MHPPRSRGPLSYVHLNGTKCARELSAMDIERRAACACISGALLACSISIRERERERSELDVRDQLYKGLFKSESKNFERTSNLFKI